jgi:ribonuclease D
MRVLTPSKAESALLAPFIGLELSQIYVPVTVGFDTESKPIFDRGVVSDGPHVVQFALASRAYIFQLHHAVGRDFLLEVFASDAVLKVGFGLKSDHREIRAKLGVTLQSVLDLNDIFRKLGHRGTTGARAAIAIVLNQKFHKSKAVTTSNWAQPVLNPKQLLYAANDAYAALRVLMALELSPDELASYR